MEERKCKQCGGPLVQKATKQTAAQRTKPFYYSAYYWCNSCHKLYHDSKFKVVNTPLFASAQNPIEKKTVKKIVLTAFNHDVEIWTDGACVSNGTPQARAAWAFVSGETERAGLVDGKQTNNVAEALAIYHALVWAGEKGYKKIKLYTDSQISIHGVMKPARLVKANREIFEDIAAVVAKNGLQIEYVKVLGHSGDPNNERVDKLANGLASR